MKRLLASIAPAKIKRALSKKKKNMPLLDYDLTRFDEQDIILESEAQIQEFLPDILGQALARTWVAFKNLLSTHVQALARTWVDKRFLNAFYDQPKEILERAGVFLPKSISVEFIKIDKRGLR